jgi:hypothetical protein
MTTQQKRKILQRIVVVENDIEALRNARTEIATNGYASATLASGGGSRSYTRLDISKLTEAIAALTSELTKLKAMLQSNGSNQELWKNVLIVYDL